MAKEKKYVARHQITMTLKPGKAGDRSKGIAPIRPSIKDVKPGERIMLDPDDKETRFLLDSGAVEEASKEDGKAPAPMTATAAVKPKDEGANEEETLLRARYEEVFGKAPSANMKVETMQKKIDEKVAEKKDETEKTDEQGGLV